MRETGRCGRAFSSRVAGATSVAMVTSLTGGSAGTPARLGPPRLGDDLHAGVQVQPPGVEHQVVADRVARVPAVQLLRHPDADPVLVLLALRGPLQADAGL